MKKFAVLIAIVAAALSISVAAASAGTNDWFITQHGHNAGQCVEKPGQGHANDDFAGPYTDSTCTTLVTNGGGGGGPSGPIPGWPADSGQGIGTFTCSPVSLTSTAPDGYGVIDFGATGGTFAQMGDGGDFAYLNGGAGGGSPRLSVFLANGDLWYVYQYDVSGPGTRYELSGSNTYRTWAQAMAIDGTQNVTDAALVVDAGWSQDGGVQSIEVYSVALTNCGGVGATLPPPPNHMFLCYSKFQQDGGAVFTNAEALALLSDPTSGYWTPFAILGTTTDGPNISGYHLACNPTGVTPSGQYLYANNDGPPEIAPYAALEAGSAGYAIAG